LAAPSRNVSFRHRSTLQYVIAYNSPEQQSIVSSNRRISPNSDLALLKRREDFYNEHHPRPPDVLLVVEVAALSLRRDRDTKMLLYARHAIPEMWLVDLQGRRLVRHRVPQQGAHTLVDEPDLRSELDVSAFAGVEDRPITPSAAARPAARPQTR